MGLPGRLGNLGTRRETTKALRGEQDQGLDGLADVRSIPILVLFGGDDIYETAAEVLRSRFPEARHVVLERSGHLPWLRRDGPHER